MPDESSGRTIAIGDIHGCAHALETVLQAIAPSADDVIISLGDFVDVGRDTLQVIDQLIALQQRCRLVTIMGNHEEMLLEALSNESLVDSWLMCGGMATVNSYKFCGTLQDIPERHVEFIKSCVEFYETEEHILVHANYEPNLAVEEFPPHTLRWSLLDDPQPQPHASGKTVIVGHTEQREGEILDLGCVKCIDTYCHGYGWLTALELTTGEVWQASRWGALREGDGIEPLQQAKDLLRP
jgi:serine/threonine protein phosphatase 1